MSRKARKQIVALLGSASGSGAAPTAPVLSMDPSWNSSQATPLFDIDADFIAGDDLQFEVQDSGGDWSSATVVHHTITSGEIGGSGIFLGIGPLANGDYEARCKFKHSGGVYSPYSNTQAFTIAATSSVRIASTGNRRISSAGNYRIAAA